ncbi:Prolyl tripeptidyl peptidase precursor [Pirellula sp. SH-Sr6A]|uniref:S9 family peptidase n=1 Tax=Pirellula sp. SH-Sr6A TaxID=1632865 RepID=UPI00078C8F5D|nr:S9 family peptidase [Pirellula sp. SH-Sr6A]AMV33373.1 Prolyl tripeptidyl peptidase precursor [Pirellula sp. SH-Sr6A]
MSLLLFRFLAIFGIATLLQLSSSGSFACGQERSSGQTPELSIDSIFQNKDFVGETFVGQWETDSNGFERIKKDVETGSASIVRIDLTAASVETVLVSCEMLTPAAAEKPLNLDSYQWSHDKTKLLIFANTQRVWRLNTRGDYWVLDMNSKSLMQIGGDADAASLMFAKFSPDAKSVAYVYKNDLYIQNLDDRSISRLTDTGSSTTINGTFDWAYEEEFSIRDGFRFSPDGKHIAFWEIDASGIELFPLVDNTSTLYPKIQYIPYPKVGTTNPAARIGVIRLASREISWVPIPGNKRDNYLPRMEWVDESRLVIQQLNRLQNQLVVYEADVNHAKVDAILKESDDAWIDVEDTLYWLPDRSQFAWLSERDGWRHIYLASIQDKSLQPVTSGDFDVTGILGVDGESKWIYFYASPSNATQIYLYRVKFDGSDLQRVTPETKTGTHRYVLSPDCKKALVTSSQFTSPPITEVVRLTDHATEFVAEPNSKLRSRLEGISLPKSKFFRVEIGDGVELDAWCILPPDHDPSKKYPLIVYVYGEPAGQTVVDKWGGDQMLWHSMLAQQGYVVMSFDNRGTPAPRGRQWRKSIYRQIGVLASADQAAAVKSVLKKFAYLDPERVGVWGWSGGGSMTLNALFRNPELYKAGVSIAPVPNQLYYDTIYQERYMGLPSDNSEGYRLGSPITYANQLKGELLLIHGTGDDNCHYQTTELLINELIKHNKSFSMFAYPNRTHAIREGENTTRHLYQMITNHFLRAIPPGPQP